MRKQANESRAFLSSILFFIVALCVGIILWNVIPVPEQLYARLFIGVSLLATVLVSVVIYQSMRIYESARTMAENMTEQLLVYSHELFSELYRSSPVPYMVIDIRGDIESVNYSAARFFHVEINALEGLNAFSFIEDTGGHTTALIPEYFKQGRFVNDVDVQIRRPDGALRWAMLSLFSFTDPTGAKKGLLTLVDVTKQKMIDKAKTEFVSLASHQLRTPISGMKWNVELLEAGNETLSELQKTCVAKIQHSLDRMETLVNDFLSASKFELGTLEAKFTALDLIGFVQGVCDEHAPTAEQKHITFIRRVEGSLILQTDSHLLHMVVSNLLSNALKYTPEGGTVSVSVIHDSERATITITDTGIGIPLNEQESIFSKMFRASNAQTNVTDGTGLGLYIVHGAVQMLRGSISFRSEEGKGTTFTVVLPV